MQIPNTVVSAIKKTKTPFDNAYFYHAESAYKALKTVTPETYCYDYMSMAICTLERFYKGFLLAAMEYDDTYQISSTLNSLHTHDVWKLYNEIKKSYIDCFPRLSRDDYKALKNTLISWSYDYTDARYKTYPEYSEFKKVMSFLTQQRSQIYTYIKETNFEQGYARPEDYEDIE